MRAGYSRSIPAPVPRSRAWPSWPGRRARARHRQSRHDHAVQLHDQRQLCRVRRRRVQFRHGHADQLHHHRELVRRLALKICRLTLINCTVSGNTASAWTTAARPVHPDQHDCRRQHIRQHRRQRPFSRKDNRSAAQNNLIAADLTNPIRCSARLATTAD